MAYVDPSYSHRFKNKKNSSDLKIKKFAFPVKLKPFAQIAP